MSRKIRSAFLLNFSKTLVVKVLVLIIGFISSVFFSKILGPSGKGQLSVSTSITGLGVQVFNLGMATANTYYISKNDKALPQVIGNTDFMFLLIIILQPIYFLIIKWMGLIVNIDSFLLILSLVFVPLSTFFMLLENHLIAKEEISYYNIVELSINLAPLCSILLVSFFVSIKPYIIIIAQIATYIIASKCILIRLKKLLNNVRVYFSGKVFLDCVRIGVKSYIACFFAFLVLRADIFMLNFYLGDVEVGIYSLAVGLSDMISMITITLGMLLFPKLCSYENQKKKLVFFIKIVGVVSVAVLLLCGVFSLLAHLIVLKLYGTEYLASGEILRILVFAAFLWGEIGLINNYYASNNRYLTPIIISIIGAVTNLILNYFFIQRFLTIGAAYASLLSYGVMCLLTYMDFIRRKGFCKL